MPFETLEDIIEEIADRRGIYGAHGDEREDETPSCEVTCTPKKPCRVCWTSGLADRIRAAVEVERKLADPTAPTAKAEPEREWRVAYETEIAGLGWREISDGNGMTEDNAEQSFQIHSVRSPIGPDYRNVRKQWRTPAGPWQDCEAKG